MEPQTISVMNWMSLVLLAPATIILVGKIMSDKLKGKSFSAELLPVLLLLGSAIVGVAGLNTGGKVGWLSLALLAAQMILLVLLTKSLWSPLRQK